MQSDVIGEFAASNNFSSLPEKVREGTRLAILNLLSVSIGANRYPQSRNIINACKEIQSGDFPIYGSGEHAAMITSAWANSSLSHLLDFDDTHLESIVHPSAPVIPSALAIGSDNHGIGRDVIYASAIGMEVAIRLALAVGLDERYSDWHNTSLFGSSASAVASSIMFHSSSELVSSSFLQGLTVATGFLSNRGTESKSFQVGRSSAEGIMSSIASKNGISVSKNIVNTFAISLSGKQNLGILTDDLGEKWNVLNNFLKPYPCGVVLHPGIDAAVEMREKNIPFDDVEEIDVEVNPVVMVLTAIMEPKSGLESKFSVTHAIAAALAYGKLFPEHFSDSAVKDPLTLMIRKKIRVHERESINRGQTVINVKFKNGGKETVDLNRGPETPSKPMDEKDISSKFSHLVDPVLGPEKAREVWAYFSKIQNKEDVAEIKELFS
ncbi:MmgE/PrpD family protein [Thermoplasmatales archaeon]|nr:MmgE/PrpD family protein [Thermoplasmatales archaeon]